MSTPNGPERPRHAFAPLGSVSNPRPTDGRMQLRGVVLDMDGTMCEPQIYMFEEMRQAINLPPSEDILDFIYAMPEQDQVVAFAKIQDIERRAMASQVPSVGLVKLLSFLDEKGLGKGICTRNFDAPVTNLLTNHVPNHIIPFSPIVTRDFRPPKPSPAGILHIAQAWGVVESHVVPATPVEERLLPLIMVGDSVDDMTAGYEAGALTVLLKSPGKESLESDVRVDVVVSRLDELIGLLEKGIESRR